MTQDSFLFVTVSSADEMQKTHTRVTGRKILFTGRKILFIRSTRLMNRCDMMHDPYICHTFGDTFEHDGALSNVHEPRLSRVRLALWIG